MRQLPITATRLISILAAGCGIYYLFTAYYGPLAAVTQRAVILGFGLLAAFLLYPPSKKLVDNRVFLFSDLLLALLSVSLCAYFAWKETQGGVYMPYYGPHDYLLGVVLIVLVLEATRRVLGMVLVGLTVFFLVYLGWTVYS